MMSTAFTKLYNRYTFFHGITNSDSYQIEYDAFGYATVNNAEPGHFYAITP